AISLLDLGKTQEALELLRRADEASPNHPQIKFNYVLALWRTGKLRDEQAIQRLNDLTQSSSADPSAFYVFGLTHLERGKLQESLIAFNHSLELDPSRKDVRHSLEEIKQLLPFDSLCLTQHVLYRRDDETTPPLFVDESGEFMLVEFIDRRIALLKIQSGQALATFVRKNNSENLNSDSYNYLAVSEDYKWNLESTSPTEILVSTVAHSKKSEPKASYRFHSVNWGKFSPCSLTTGTPTNSQTLKIVPDANGVSVFSEQASQAVFDATEEDQLLTAFAVAPNGKWLITGGDESLIRLWNVSQKRCMRTFHAVGGVVEALWFDPKARIVVSLAKRNICQIWRVMLLCNHPKKLRAPHLLCLINSSEELQERQAQMEKIYKKAKEAAEQGDNSNLIQAYRAAKEIQGWQSERDKFENLLERRIPRSNLEDAVQAFQVNAHDNDVSTLALAWDSSFLISAGKDRAIRLWSDPSNQSEEPTRRREGVVKRSLNWKQTLELTYHYEWVRSIALSPNNRFLASGGWDHRVVLWDLAKGTLLFTLPEQVKNLTKLSFAPDGRTIATATANGAVTLWDLATAQILIRLDVGSGYTRALSFSRD
ncbi:MAG: hypothetical protein J6X44_01630, partial [Thermoguttaceae bacterium]|nr:hypothetical protein [Thermoguttaceae bacterium]